MEHDAEGVLVADIDLGLIPVAKYFMTGWPLLHAGNMQLFVDASRQKPVFILGEEEPEGPLLRGHPVRSSVESRHPEGAAQVVFARHRAAPSAIPTSLGARAHQNHLDKFPNDYCHIPRELMRKYFQKVE